MGRQDFEILIELQDTVEKLGQRVGSNPKRGPRPSSQRLRKELAKFADECQRGLVEGRARKRKAGDLFRKIISQDPDVW